MKNIKHTIVSLALTLLISSAAVLSPLPVYAAGGSISLVANKATVAPGGSLIVAIYMNGGGAAVYGVEADLSYPSSKLQYVGFSGSGSAFEIAASNGGSDGLATVARGTVNAVSGSGLVGTATFKAITSSGSATVSVAGSSSLSDGNGTPVPYAPGAVSVNFGAAAAQAPAASSTAPPAAPVVVAPKDTTPPVISKIHVKELTPFSAVINWSTDEPSDSTIDYGLDANYGLSASLAGLTTSHDISLSSAFLTPKLLLHYRLKSVDAAGNVQTGSDQTLQLPGVPVSVIVKGDNGRPQADALVTLDDQTATTDSKGQANLTSSLGSKQVVISFGGVTVRRPIMVARTTKPLPPYRLDLAKQPLNHWMVTSFGLMIVVLTLLGIDVALFGSTFIRKLIRWRLATAPITLTPTAVAQSSPEETLPVPTKSADTPNMIVTDTPVLASPLSPSSQKGRSISDFKIAPVVQSLDIRQTTASPNRISVSSETETAPLVVTQFPKADSKIKVTKRKHVAKHEQSADIKKPTT